MSNDKVSPFPVKGEGVPIIGQPCNIVSWFPTTVLVCNCEAKQPVTVIGFNNISVCPHCGRGFRLHGVQQDIRTGKPPHFNIDVVVMPPTSGKDAPPA